MLIMYATLHQKYSMGWPNDTSKYCILMLVVYTILHKKVLMGRPNISSKYTNVSSVYSTTPKLSNGAA